MCMFHVRVRGTGQSGTDFRAERGAFKQNTTSSKLCLNSYDAHHRPPDSVRRAARAAKRDGAVEATIRVAAATCDSELRDARFRVTSLVALQMSVVITGVPLDAVSSVGGRPAVSARSSSTYAVASPAPPPAAGGGGSTMHTRRAWLECARIAALTARTAAGAPRDASQPHSPNRSGGWWAACEGASRRDVASTGSAAAAAAAGRRA